jgi:hypothetical protein
MCTVTSPWRPMQSWRWRRSAHWMRFVQRTTIETWLHDLALAMPMRGRRQRGSPPTAPDLCCTGIDSPPTGEPGSHSPAHAADQEVRLTQGFRTLLYNLMQFVAIINIVEIGQIIGSTPPNDERNGRQRSIAHSTSTLQCPRVVTDFFKCCCGACAWWQHYQPGVLTDCL